ncbi:MAG: hypothetical protein ACD_54C00066G0003 [uncultured bacterium]|nr:MAG: hypothetical protein ACD_54C00066G0003 [uncultured bacterium]
MDMNLIIRLIEGAWRQAAAWNWHQSLARLLRAAAVR